MKNTNARPPEIMPPAPSTNWEKIRFIKVKGIEAFIIILLLSVGCSKNADIGWAYVTNDTGFELVGEMGLIGDIPMGESYVPCQIGNSVYIQVTGIGENDWYGFSHHGKKVSPANKRKAYAKMFNRYVFFTDFR